ncbi:MFS transporter [Streptosporangium sp. CA-135522]|uniref:MFS transporter n=1 Tax=Streptosporangium sp. CA-135522 TaxID=3240072 RepID=UPI003D90BEE4
MSATVPFRLARASAFAAVSVGLGVVAHVFAGGTVSAWGAAGGLALALAAALPMTGRERGLAAILPLLGGGQAMLHLLFAATDAAASHRGRSGLLPDLATLVTHPHSGLLPGLAMLVMHGWAVGLTALWLARGEALLWALLRRLGARLGPVLTGEPPSIFSPPSAAPHRDEAVLRPSPLRHVVSRRGPPLSPPVTSR